MKKTIALYFFLIPCFAWAQSVGIGTQAPNKSAALDITSNTQGLLVPRMSSSDRDAIINPGEGLIIFCLTDSSFYFYTGTWRKLIPADQAWSIKGNTGIDTALNFIGTIDDKAIRFRVFNTLRMQLDSFGRLQLYGPNRNLFLGFESGLSILTGGENHFIGIEAGRANTTGFENHYEGFRAGRNGNGGFHNHFVGYEAGLNNVAIQNYFTGYRAGQANTTGLANHFEGFEAGMNNTIANFNQFTGFWAGRANTTGRDNYFSGNEAGTRNTTGNDNVFIGNLSGLFNTTGSDNHFSGYLSGQTNTKGNRNTLVGHRANVTSDSLNNAGAIGYSAMVSQDNSFVIGGTGADAVNVGIGTTAPQHKLDIQDNGAGTTIAMFRNTGGFGQIKITQGTTVTDLGAYPTGGYVGTNLPGDFKLRTGAIDRIFIEHATGFVGIGTNTPVQRLHVVGNVLVDGSIINELSQIPGLEGTWTSFGFGTAGPSFYKDKENRVHLSGIVNNTASPIGTTIFTLPAGYRPTAGNLAFGVLNNISIAQLSIVGDGRIIVNTGSAGWFNLSGISFRVQ